MSALGGHLIPVCPPPPPTPQPPSTHTQVISAEKSRSHIFRLTGPGADQDPKGLFTIDMETGDVSVSRSLDREAIESYQVCVCLCSILTCLPGSSSSPSFSRMCSLTLIPPFSLSALVYSLFPAFKESVCGTWRE